MGHHHKEHHHTVRKVVQSKWLQVIAGSFLMLSTFATFLQLHHGIFVMGIYHAAQMLPDIVQASERILRFRKDKK